MAKLRVHNFSISLDGFGAGPDQDLDNPLGVGGRQVHDWVFASPAGQKMLGMEPSGERSIDDEFIEAGETGIGATVMGRNMFGPIRGDWGDDQWRGWWGDEPPYHHPVFVLTHHAHEPIEMIGTTFHFVTDGIESALSQAFDAAGGKDVRLGGGVATVKAYMRAGLVDEMHVAIAPVFLGSGERLFDGGVTAGYEVVEMIGSGAVTHVRIAKKG